MLHPVMATMPCRVLQVRSFALAYTCNTCHVFSFLSFLGPHRALARIALLMTSPQRPPKQPLPRSSPSHARPRQSGYGGQRFLFVSPQDASAPTAPEVRLHNFPISVHPNSKRNSLLENAHTYCELRITHRENRWVRSSQWARRTPHCDALNPLIVSPGVQILQKVRSR